MDHFINIWIKRDGVRLEMLLNRRISDGKNGMALLFSKKRAFPDGVEMFKNVVLASINTPEEKELPLLADLLRIALLSGSETKQMVEIVKSIVTKFDNRELQIKLLTYSDKNTEYKNALDLIACQYLPAERPLWEYFLSLIDDDDVDKEALIKPGQWGQSPLLRLVSRHRNVVAHLVFEKFDGQKANLLMTKDDYSGKSMLEQWSQEMIAKHLSYLEEDQLPQFIIDNMVSYYAQGILFTYVQEQAEIRDDLLQDLLFTVKRQSDGASFLMIMMQMCVSSAKSYINWIWRYIMELEADQIDALLTQIDDKGNNLLHHCAKCNLFDVHQNVMKLYTDDDIKKRAITQMNHEGKTSFALAIQTVDTTFQAHCYWNMRASDTEGFLLSNQERLKLMSDSLPEWKCVNVDWRQWLTSVLGEMERMEPIELLVPLWKAACVHCDIDFANLLLSKLDEANGELVTAFLTAQSGTDKNSSLHFAAAMAQDRIEMMESLLALADKASVSITTILLDPELSRNHQEHTPLMEAVSRNHIKITSLILSRFSAKKEKQKLILMDKRVDQTLSYKNWFEKKQHEIRQNVVIVALRALADQTDYLRATTRMPMVKLLVESCDNIKAVLKYENSIQESIYHYLLTKDVCEYFKGIGFRDLDICEKQHT